MSRSLARFIAGAVLVVSLVPVVRAAAEFVTADQVHIPRTVQEDIQTWVYPGLEIRAFPVKPITLWSNAGCGFLGMVEGGAFSFYQEDTAMLKRTNLFVTGDYNLPYHCGKNTQLVTPLPYYMAPSSQSYAFDTITYQLTPSTGKAEIWKNFTEEVSGLEFKRVGRGIYAVKEGTWKRLGHGRFLVRSFYPTGTTMYPFGVRSVGWIAEDGRLFVAQVTDFNAMTNTGIKDLPPLGSEGRWFDASFPFRFEGSPTVYESRALAAQGRSTFYEYVEYPTEASYLTQHPEDTHFALVQTLPKELAVGFTYCPEAFAKPIIPPCPQRLTLK